MPGDSIRFCLLTALLATATAWLTACGEAPTPVERPEPFIKAVHYFSDDWPKNFWEDFENSQTRQELEQIRNDGFNTVILVVPWRGFETGFQAGATKPSVLYERLEYLLGEIEAAGLGFGLRVGFPHHFDPASGTDIWPLCHAVFTEPGARDNWRAYLDRIAERIEPYRSAFRFAFFSWEDFFCPYSVMPGLPAEQRLEIARASGYQEWLAETQELDQVSFLYSESFAGFDAIPVPERDSPAFWLFIRFVDRFLIQELVMPGRTAIPELSMEVRVDKDGVRLNDRMNWVEHDLMLEDMHIRGSYWGPYHGAVNEGETLDADAALRNLEYMLKRVSDDAKNRRHVLEQFNFIDNTPNFEDHHARIDMAQMETFLQGAAGLLQRYSIGYGLWAYRDYPDTVLYNGSFELGLRGWESGPGVDIVTNAQGDLAANLESGSTLSQAFPPYDRFAALGLGKFLTFCAHYEGLAEPTQITLSVNGEVLGSFTVQQGGNRCESLDVERIRHRNVTFTVTTTEKVRMDDLRLFAFEQQLGVYNRDGSPGPLRETVVRMNREWLPGE